MQGWQWDPVDLVWFGAPRGEELSMTSGTVGLRFHQVLGWGAPSRTPVVVRLSAAVEESAEEYEVEHGRQPRIK